MFGLGQQKENAVRPARPAPSNMGEALLMLLADTRDALVSIVERRFGITRAYIEDIRDNIRFEDSRVECITFLAIVDGATGAVTAVTPVQRIHPEYLFAWRRVHGFFSDPSNMGPNIPLLEATIREAGRGIDCLLTPINMGSIVPGTGHDRIEWETPYTFREAAEITVTFALRPEAAPGGLVTWAPLPTERNQIIGIVLVGDLVRKKILP